MAPFRFLPSRDGAGGAGAAALLALLSLSSLPDSVEAECKYLHVNITETMVMREFLFISGRTDCINVKVYWSETEPDSSDVYGELNPDKWQLMCDSNVVGQGDGDHTVLPANHCVPVPVTAGETVWFYFGIEEIAADLAADLCTGSQPTLTYELMQTDHTVYGFCPANNTATLPFLPIVESQGGSSPIPAPDSDSPTAAPAPGPSDSDSPTAAPAPGPSDTGSPTLAPTTSPAPTTFAPTVTKAPATDRPTRHPITAKPTGSDRLTLSVPTDVPGGYVDPSGEITVDPGDSVTFSFFPQICLEVDQQATGILYGHFDADYMAGFDHTEFPITYTPGEGVYGVDWGPRTGDTGEFSYPTGTDAHDHEYDEDCDCVFVDYIRPSASMKKMEDIMKENIMNDDSFSGDAEVAKNNLVFKLIAINGDINTAGFFVINDNFNHYDPTTFHSVVTWDDKDVDDLPMLTWGDPTDTTNWNPDMPQALRDQVIHVDEIAMGYKYDAIRRGKGGIIPTNTGDMKGNVPGQYLEWRNGALTMQVVKVNPTTGEFVCTMKPEWSNASVPIKEGDPDYDPLGDPCAQKKRSPQGPVDWCPPGYNVLYEGTLFWHWSGGCDGGSSSYHGDAWEDDYESFFTADCRGVDENGQACVFHELCWVMLDGQEACLNDANQLTLSDIQSDHQIEAAFAAVVNGVANCPPPPTPAPTISHAPTISFSPTEAPTTASPTRSPSDSPSASPTISHAPTINQFKRDVLEALDDTTGVGACWRWAHTFSCYPGSDSGGAPTCSRLEGDQAADITRISISGEEPSSDYVKCCPLGDTFATAEDVTDDDCITFEVYDSNGASVDLNGDPVCVDVTTKITSADGKIIKTGTDFDLVTGTTGADEGFAVKLSVANHCSSCYIHYAEAFAYQTNKGSEPYNHCPADSGSTDAWGGDYSSWSTAGTVKKLYKEAIFGFKGDKQKLPYAFAAGLWCGQLDVDGDNANDGCDGTQSDNYVINTIG